MYVSTYVSQALSRTIPVMLEWMDSQEDSSSTIAPSLMADLLSLNRTT